MIIPAQNIRRLCNPEGPEYPPAMVAPFNERTVHDGGMTFGLSPAGYDVRIAEEVHLTNGLFALASTIEKFDIPNDVLAYVKDKSSWARKGVALQNTVIEPGWCGFLTLEITMHAMGHIMIPEGSPIAQIVFHRLEQPTEQPYRGKYQNQRRGPVEAIRE